MHTHHILHLCRVLQDHTVKDGRLEAQPAPGGDDRHLSNQISSSSNTAAAANTHAAAIAVPAAAQAARKQSGPAEAEPTAGSCICANADM